LFSPEFFESIGKLFVALFGIFRKIILAFNPGLELDESEKAWPFKDKKPDHKTLTFHKRLVQIFDSAGEEGRKLYRSLLTRIDQGEKLTSEQMLYELLKEVKNSTLFKKNGHEIMSKIEDLLCGNESKIEKLVANQLNDAFESYNGGKKDEFNNNKESIINAIKQACAILVKKIKELKEKLTDNKDELSESEKFNLWQVLQTSRLKLSSCLLKIKAFSQGATVLIDGEFNKQFEKFFGKITDDLTLKAIAKAANPAECADASKGKSILKLFECLDTSKDIAHKQFNEDYNEALNRAKQSRKTEIENQIAVDGRIDSMVSKLTEIREIFAPAEEHMEQINVAIARLDNIKLNKVQLPGTIDSFDVNGYTNWKQRANDYIDQLSFLESCANRIIADYINPAPQQQQQQQQQQQFQQTAL
jgi:uncharacterized protein YecT (DUF1311 family)